jgi:transposase
MDPEERAEIMSLAERGLSIRAIARKLGRNVKTIRAALSRPPQEAPPNSKLEPFKPFIQECVAKGLMGPRILREIRARGYTGGRTILGEYVATLRPRQKSKRPVRRFETKPAKEAQIDWSPYRVMIGGIETLVHCFSMVLCYSRRLFIAFFKNERVPTLLWAHVEAFRYHGGSTRRIVYDNMTQISLGRIGNQPIWHEHFKAFVAHYGFKPYCHRVGHKERSGKVERPFWYIENDFLKGSAFESWDDLNAKARVWLETIANVRPHGTTKRRVDAMYAEEKDLLIKIPPVEFGTDRREVRKVAVDGTVCVDASLYPVPARLIGQHVVVRVYPTRVEVLDAAGTVVAAHEVPERPMRVPAPGEPPPATPSVSRPALEAAFLARFPGTQTFLDGLHRRMKALLPIHLKKIEHLAALFGEARVRAAIDRASFYGNYSAAALERMLEKAHPTIVPEAAIEPITADPAALGALDEIDSGSPEDYDFDSREASDEPKP